LSLDRHPDPGDPGLLHVHRRITATADGVLHLLRTLMLDYLADAPPQGGLNLTSAWLPGEAVADSVELTSSPGARPGRYALWLRFYDTSMGACVPLDDAKDEALPDARLKLTQVMVQP
jgi:hypothetical protein